MVIVSALTCLVFILAAAFLLLKNYHAQFVLIFCGLAMTTISIIYGVNPKEISGNSGLWVLDMFNLISLSFSSKLADVGLMIMVIGGYVAYMDHIGASKTLVYIAMKPLSIFKKNPYIAASFVIPIGHLLSIPIPSATGLGLLLIASVFPILVELGVSRVSAVSVIVSTTIFDMGPASANTLLAAELVGKSTINYFIQDQFRICLPLILLSSTLYFFINRYYDKKIPDDLTIKDKSVLTREKPIIYGLLPILPLIILLIFSELFSFFDPAIQLSTTTAMFMSLLVALTFEMIHKKNKLEVVDSLKIFWSAMGKVFASVVTLIIAAELFAGGLINLGFISFLVNIATDIGIEAIGIAIIMTLLIYSASVLMGSGNASFYSFGPLVPDIALKMGADSSMIILPMQLSASMGRALSPISGVVIATAEIAGVTPLQIVKRNFIPTTITFIALLILSL